MAKAICHFNGTGEPGEISGTVSLFQVAVSSLLQLSLNVPKFLSQPAPDAELEITGEITGLPTGVHGIQIREFADFTQGAATAGAICNPDGKPHGGPLTTERMGESKILSLRHCAAV